jgi:transposase
MSKTFRPWKIDEPLLLPLLVQDFVAEDHLARFVLSLVRDEIDLAAITASYDSERGQPPFDPVMMTALLLYSYCCGIYASRRIAKACRERVDFMSIVGFDAPDFRTVSEFRRRHLKALGALFSQILHLCETAGLVKLGHVALDGTKIKANASKHKAMSYERMDKRAAELEAEVAKWLAVAEATDAEEDKLYGADKSGEAMPDWVADKKRRAERIRNAKAELEAEAKASAEAKRKAAAEAQQRREAEGRKKSGRQTAPPSTVPDPKAQKNFTDPESRIMKSKDGFVQAYNAQIAVDSAAQIIVAQDVTQSAVDSGQLVPMTDAVETNLGRKPEQLSADAGYCSEANLEALETRDIDGYVATGRARDAVAGNKGDAAVAPPAPDLVSAATPESAAKPEAEPKPAAAPSHVETMRAKIKAGGHASPYRLRKQLPEPVFGQIKEARGFRQFLLRGFEKVRDEWSMVCTAHNLLKLAQGWSPSVASPRAA